MTSSPPKDALSQLRFPALGLCSVGVLNGVFCLATLAALRFGLRPPWIKESAEPLTQLDSGTLLSVAAALTSAALTLWGATSALKLQRYGLCFMGALASMMPLSPTCVPALPFGVWLLVVLNRPQVRAAFPQTGNPAP